MQVWLSIPGARGTGRKCTAGIGLLLPGRHRASLGRQVCSLSCLLLGRRGLLGRKKKKAQGKEKSRTKPKGGGRLQTDKGLTSSA